MKGHYWESKKGTYEVEEDIYNTYRTDMQNM